MTDRTTPPNNPVEPAHADAIGRRGVLLGIGATAAFPASGARAVPIGAATRLVVASGGGVTVARPAAAGRWSLTPRAMTGELIWAVPHRGGVVACIGGARDRVVMIGRDGSVVAAGRAAGHDACHLAVDPSGRLAAVADYGLGAISLHRLDQPGDGQVVVHTGRGGDPSRQAGPHAHWVGFSPDGQWLHAVDLGADAVFAHRIERGRVVDTMIAWQAPPATGPRHMVRHPHRPIAYIVGELANTLDTVRVDADGRFTTLRRQSTLDPDASGVSYAGHVAIDPAGRMLYVSNRGADTIAVFSLADPARPRLVQQAPVGGHWPRFFLLRRGSILVANERSPAMSILAVEPTGRLGNARPGPPVAHAKFAIPDWQA